MSDPENRALAFVDYWRRGLADAENGKGGLSQIDTKDWHRLGRDELESGVAKNLADQLFEHVPGDVKILGIAVRPFVYAHRLEHAHQKRNGLRELITPVIARARIDREGRLYPVEGGSVVARDLLEPTSLDGYSIGSVEALDEFLTHHPFSLAAQDDALHDGWSAQAWGEYLSYCARLQDQICKNWLSEIRANGDSRVYDLLDHALIAEDGAVFNASKHILSLYDHMQAKGITTGLFERYAREAVDKPEPIMGPEGVISEILGHSTDRNPLAPAQRQALSCLMQAKHGDIIAVNGPPGTGKTTLILSAVASLWVRSALDGGTPPVILAASTNNQAVTNIIDAFGKNFAPGDGPLAGRWLPDVSSFGAYFPSSNKKDEAAQKYQTLTFFEQLEDAEYVAKAESHFLEKARIWVGGCVDDVQNCLSAIETAMRREADRLTHIEDSWKRVLESRGRLRRFFDGVQSLDWLEMEKARSMRMTSAERSLRHFRDQWLGYLSSESIWWAMFSWAPPVLRKRGLMAEHFVKSNWPKQLKLLPIGDIDSFDEVLRSKMQSLAKTRDGIEARIREAEDILRISSRDESEWGALCATLPMVKVGESSVSAFASTLAECDMAADTSIRFDLFRLATHYWEARWLMAIKGIVNLADEKKRRGATTMRERWHRRMMITPCVVTTFHMLPSHLQFRRKDNEWVDDYLFDFADLLIVDEAGQVLPEVAGASFALAQKALVIGDTQQIEPIWSVPRSVDVGNLVRSGIIPRKYTDADIERLESLGKTTSSGSVMALAQHQCRYQADQDLSRGLWLYEHRRCYESIVDYCNALCYRGKLIPKRKDPIGNGDQFPLMGYLHIDGACHQTKNSNLLEAQTIAAWLAENRGLIEKRYNKPIGQVVGVVTPFADQKKAIEASCQEKGISAGSRDGDMTVGTVHALQGAERDIVIFSPTYSKHRNGGFIDRSNSMLNVAVSRSKDSFLVFGDMDVFVSASASSPRGILFSFLSKGGKIDFPPLPRLDLFEASRKPRTLIDSGQHDSFLREALASAKRSVVITSPWASVDKVTIFSEDIRAAVLKGVVVSVYVDQLKMLEKKNGRGAVELESVKKAIESVGAVPVLVSHVHAKVVVVDDAVMCVGSFNWFSAARDGDFKMLEVSHVYNGSRVSQDAKVYLKALDGIRIKPQFY